MSWTTALADLRSQLADNTQNRLAHRKKVFGDLDGTNTVFKTFEPRLISDFTAPVPPAGVYLGGVLQTVVSHDLVSGEFELASAPTDNGQALLATYYYQWFLDTELTQFLTNAANYLLTQPDFTQMPNGLIPAALQAASGDAMRFLALRWAERASTTFLLEDAPKKESLGIADTYAKQAKLYADGAEKLRNSFYTKNGQALAANFGSSWGRVSNVTPRR